MTDRSTWKKFERKIAKELGGIRIPCSGNGRLVGDVLMDDMMVECKLRQSLIIHTWYEKAKEDSKRMKVPKPVLLVVKMKNKHSTYVVMEIEDFKQFLEAKNADTARETGKTA